MSIKIFYFNLFSKIDINIYWVLLFYIFNYLYLFYWLIYWKTYEITLLP